MSGHTPYTHLSHKNWPPGQLHDDLQVDKKEVFRFGDWSIYDATKVSGRRGVQWSSFIMHCRTWKEWEPVTRPPATTYVKGEMVQAFDKAYSIQVAKRCNANMTAETISNCPECGITIPMEVVALWKLQNFDKIQELNSA